MLSESIIQLLLQWLFSVLGCFFFLAIGNIIVALASKLFSQDDDREWSHLFYSLLHGLLFTVSIYAVIAARFCSIFILVIAAYVWAIFPALKNRIYLQFNFGRLKQYLPYIIGISLFFVLVFNYLPESEYKQNDSFFYLKIAETLKGLGNENISHYYNFFDKDYTGVEPYHYFELWTGAFIMNFTGDLLPHIQVFRIVLYAILSVTMLTGLFYAASKVMQERPSPVVLLFCFSFLFFLPDVLDYSNVIRHYAIYNFENNLLERPNFRTIYLFFLPVLFSLLNDRPGRNFFFYLICFCVISHLIFLIMLPAALLCFLFCVNSKTNKKDYQRLFSGAHILSFAIFALSYISFYYFFASKKIADFYNAKISDIFLLGEGGLRYVLISIFTSFAYLLIIVTLVAGAVLVISKVSIKHWVLRYKIFFVCISSTVISGILMARIFGFKDNAYQLAYPAYIAASLFIFFVILYCGTYFKRMFFFPLLVIFFVGSYVLQKIKHQKEAFVNVFVENGINCYEGKKYEKGYVKNVLSYFNGRKNTIGAYIADTSFYRDLYYSRRNGNVYCMPIHYLIAGKAVSNFDFCLSDSSSIVYGDVFNGLETAYLKNAFQRSFFTKFSKGLPGMDHTSRVKKFIDRFQIKYLVLSASIDPEKILTGRNYSGYRDGVTGEQFIMLQ